MKITRRSLGRTGLLGLTLSSSTKLQLSGEQEARTHYLFQNPTFENIFLTSLGRAYYSGGNVGKVLYLSRQVKDGDF